MPCVCGPTRWPTSRARGGAHAGPRAAALPLGQRLVNLSLGPWQGQINALLPTHRGSLLRVLLALYRSMQNTLRQTHRRHHSAPAPGTFHCRFSAWAVLISVARLDLLVLLPISWPLSVLRSSPSHKTSERPAQKAQPWLPSINSTFELSFALCQTALLSWEALRCVAARHVLWC